MKNNKIILIIMMLSIIVFVLLLLFSNLNKKDSGIYVYFFPEGGTFVEKIKINVGDNVILPSTEKEGYKFLGWYRNDVKVSNDTRYNETTTLYAKWIKDGEDTYTVVFDSNGGNSIENLIVECNKALNLPVDPVREGYEFVSWVDNNNNPVLNQSILTCENVVLKAEWKQKEVKKEEVKEKKYICPNGYTLKDSKCLNEKDALSRCPNGSILDGDICISENDINNGNYVCKNIDVEINNEVKNVQGEYFNGKCGYYTYELLQDDCNYTWDNGKCYSKVVEGNFDITCNDGYILNNNNCKKIIEKEFYCDNGYNLNNNRCIRTIDATLR